jgi:O-antigen/teichoic acid export membrane protein
MTTKVVKGSLWTLMGQVAPMAVSLVAMRYTIGLLGPDGYGLLTLVALIPNYFLFADFGMGMAAVRFGAAAYAEGDAVQEGRIVRTAALVAFAAAVPIALAMFLLSGTIISFFDEVPEAMRGEASIALKIASVTLVVTLLCSIVNTPQLTRLRMDLNTFINAGTRIAGLVATPVVIYLGFGVIGAVTVLLVAGVLNLTGHVLVSTRLLPSLAGTSIDRYKMPLMLKFGASLVAGSIGALFLANLEKVLLPKMVSVRALGFYTAAFTFITMMTLFSNAMIQSLIPAFSRLQSEHDRGQLQGLYARGIRLTLLGLAPAIVFLVIAAQPFFRLYLGEEFGRESPPLFYLLLFGLVFNVPAYLPYAAIMARGRTDLFAKLFFIELVPYLLLVVFLTQNFGALGAAVAWSIKTSAEGVLWFVLARRFTGLTLSDVRLERFALAAMIMLVPLAASLYFSVLNAAVVILFTLSFMVYVFVLWKIVLGREETAWITARLSSLAGRATLSL